MKKAIIYSIFILLLCSICYAAPPVTSVQQFTIGYVVKFPFIETIKQNQEYHFNFHVFNISNGMPIYDSKCIFHLYNESGDHTAEMNVSFVNYDSFDYEFEVNSNNFTRVGEYSYIIQCYNTTHGLGGYIEQSILVTFDGHFAEESVLTPVVLFCGIFASIFIIGGILVFSLRRNG